MEEKTKKSFKKKVVLFVFAGIFIVFAAFFATCAFIYNQDLNFAQSDETIQNFVVKEGSSISSVAAKLKSADMISSKISFEIYARLNKKTSIKAGRYELKKSMKIPEIVDILNNGQVLKNFSVMFLPGGTVAMAKKTLIKTGFSESEVEAALSKDYSKDFAKLFEGKPEGADLEGFLYGETHIFEKGISAEDVVRRFLKDFEDKVMELDLSSKFKKQGLSLYEGITLASIVQKETLADAEDKKMVAGVFYNRMKSGMNLGSDVTYQYIADKLGIERDYNLDNPYNLRKYAGLTPTPISTPNLDSLKAVAEPASHDYLFFLSGDDDKTYFAKTEAEHQQNIKKFCQKKCLIV